MKRLDKLTNAYESKRTVRTKDLSYGSKEEIRQLYDRVLSGEISPEELDEEHTSKVRDHISHMPPDKWYVDNGRHYEYLKYFAEKDGEDYEALLSELDHESHRLPDAEAYKKIYKVHRQAFEERFFENEIIRRIDFPKKDTYEYDRMVGGLRLDGQYKGEMDDQWRNKFQSWKKNGAFDRDLRGFKYPSLEEFQVDFESQRMADFIADKDVFVYGKVLSHDEAVNLLDNSDDFDDEYAGKIVKPKVMKPVDDGPDF